MTEAQAQALARTIRYADDYAADCEASQVTDPDELWSIIQVFIGVASSILDHREAHS